MDKILSLALLCFAACGVVAADVCYQPLGGGCTSSTACQTRSTSDCDLKYFNNGECIPLSLGSIDGSFIANCESNSPSSAWTGQLYMGTTCGGSPIATTSGNDNTTCSAINILFNTVYGTVNCGAPKVCDAAAGEDSSTGVETGTETGTETGGGASDFKDCFNRTATVCENAGCTGECVSVRGGSAQCFDLASLGKPGLYAAGTCFGDLSTSAWVFSLYLNEGCGGTALLDVTGNGMTCVTQTFAGQTFHLQLDCGLASQCLTEGSSSSGVIITDESSSTGNHDSAAMHTTAASAVAVAMAALVAVAFKY